MFGLVENGDVSSEDKKDGVGTTDVKVLLKLYTLAVLAKHITVLA